MLTKGDVWDEPKDHSTEGHIFTCVLTFRNKTIWGPATCHDNTVALRNALHYADRRFDIIFTKKDRTLEGHTRYISVKSNGETILDRLSTHPNMDDMITAINTALGNA